MILKEKIDSIKTQIELAQNRGGFDHPVQLIAVTKTHPFSIIKICYDIGITAIGENQVQEASQKFESFKTMINLKRRFIGHLQSNKVKKCLELFDTIDSVDSVKLAKKISNAALYLGKKVPVLLEINTSGESQKHGFLPNQLTEVESCFEQPNINIEGLMTVGPLTKDKEKIRESFVQLREFKDLINKSSHSTNLTELSIGMSGDYEIAVEEGSTMVRLGTALFGKRKPQTRQQPNNL